MGVTGDAGVIPCTRWTENRSSRQYRGDATSPRDAHVTPGVTPTSERGDAHVADGVTPTSPKPSFEPPTNRPMNRGELAVVDNTPADPSPSAWPEGPPAPIDTDGFTVTDSMRRWANEVHPHIDLQHSTQQFISHYRSTGTRRRNWPEAWRKWIAEDAQRGSRPLRAVSGDRNQQATDDWFERSMARARARDEAAAEGDTP